MSETTAKLSIANIAILTLGDTQITAIDDTTPVGKKINAIFEKVVKFCMCDDWNFNRERKLLSGLTAIKRLEVDTSPSPAAWSVGATITGGTSSVTCTVKRVLSDTVYLVTEPSDDFTDGEILSDGTNSVDCDTDYPQVDDELEMGEYDYAFSIPSDYLYNRGISDKYSDDIIYKTKREGDILLSQVDGDFEGYYNYNRFVGSGSVSAIESLPEWFHRLISARLAFVLSANITENLKIRPKAEIDWRDAYLQAKEANGTENNNPDYSGNTDWSDRPNNLLESL